MLINLRPIRVYRDFRLLLIGQAVSFVGTMVSYVAVPWQVFALTKSSFQVGLIGAVQLVPLLIFGLIGGSVADRMDRRKLMMVSEGFMALCSLALCLNAWRTTPSLSVIFIASAVGQAANGFHRPAMEALIQKLVKPVDYSSVSAINMLYKNICGIAAPALGGIIIASAGVGVAFLVDFASFLVAVITVSRMRPIPALVRSSSSSTGSGISEGLRYAIRCPELMGTYLIDIIAMTFAFPTALFPEMGVQFGGARATGMLYSSMALGSTVLSLFSGWTEKVRRHGVLVVISATLWGIAVIGAGLSHRLSVVLVFLMLAGAADAVSGIFRGCIWNEIVPNEIRGRLAGIEMISYMTGPLLGNTRAGWVAGITGLSFSIVSGGVLCAAGVPLCAFFYPKLWAYRSSNQATPQ